MDLSDLLEYNFETLPYDKAIKLLEQVRLSRKIPVKKRSKTTKAKINKTKISKNITPEQALELLDILGESPKSINNKGLQ